MKNVCFLFICLFLIKMTKAQSILAECIYTPEDQTIVVSKLKEFTRQKDRPVNELLITIGLSFRDTPYMASSLENGPEEKMVVNLRGLDCTTFVESVLALVRTVKQNKSDFESYVTELQSIRYRNGQRNCYPSRLHYFSEWIDNNQEKGIVDGTINKKGSRFSKTIQYMSTHPDSYPVLKDHPEMVPVIEKLENKLVSKELWYFPKDNIPNLYGALKNGDIVALTSSLDGIDINHVGIAIKKGNEFYLLHASQSAKKVVVSDGPLTDFLKPASKNSGIMIARPVF